MPHRSPQPRRGGLAGMGIDFQGGPVIDPTENVISLVNADAKRQDNLRESAKELSDAKIAHQKEIGRLTAAHAEILAKAREEHQEKMASAESGRLNSIRQVDREEVAKTAVAANLAITTLAKQTTDLQTTLQKQVADTAVAVEQRQSASYTDTNKRLSAVELALSEGKGKQQVADPAIERMAAMVEKLVTTQALGAGHKEGMSDGVKLLVTLLTIGSMLLGFYTFTQKSPVGPDPMLAAILNELRTDRAPAPAPQILYAPARAGTMLPSTPPASVPR